MTTQNRQKSNAKKNNLKVICMFKVSICCFKVVHVGYFLSVHKTVLTVLEPAIVHGLHRRLWCSCIVRARFCVCSLGAKIITKLENDMQYLFGSDRDSVLYFNMCILNSFFLVIYLVKYLPYMNYTNQSSVLMNINMFIYSSLFIP